MSTILDTVVGGLLGGLAAKFNTKGDKGSAVHQSNQYNIERLEQLNTVFSSMGEGYLRVDEVFGQVSGQKNGEPENLSELFGAKESIVELIKKDLNSIDPGNQINAENKNLRRLVTLFNNFQSKDRYLIDKYELFEDLTKSGKFYDLPKIMQDKLTPTTMERMGYEILNNQDTNLTLSINLTKMQNLIQTGIFIINGQEFLRDDLYTSEVTNREVKDAGTTFDKSAVLSYIKKIDPGLEKEFDRNFIDVVLEKTQFAENLTEEEKAEVRKTLKEKGLDKNFSEALQVIGTESVSGLTGGYGHDVAYINYMGYFHGETFFTTQAQMVGKWCKKIFDEEGVRTLRAWEAGDDNSIDPKTGYSRNEIPIIKRDLFVEGEDGKMHRIPTEFYSAKEYFLSADINANTKDLYGFEYDAYRQFKDGVPEDEIKLTKRDLLYFTMIETSAEAHHNMNSSRDFSKTATLMTEALELAISSGEISLPKSLAELEDTYKSYKQNQEKADNLKGTVENPVTFSNEHIARFTCAVSEAMGNVKGSMLYERGSKEGKIRATAKYIGKEEKAKPNSRRKDPIIKKREIEELEDPEIPLPKWREQYKYLALASEQIVEEPQNAASVGTGQIAKEGLNKVLDSFAAPFRPDEKSWNGKASSIMDNKAEQLEVEAKTTNNIFKKVGLRALEGAVKVGKAIWDNKFLIGAGVVAGAIFPPAIPYIAGTAAGVATAAVGLKYVVPKFAKGGETILGGIHGSKASRFTGKIIGGLAGVGLTAGTIFGGYKHASTDVKEYGDKELQNFKNIEWYYDESTKSQTLTVDGNNIDSTAIYINDKIIKPKAGDQITIPEKTELYSKPVVNGTDTSYVITGFLSPAGTQIELQALRPVTAFGKEFYNKTLNKTFESKLTAETSSTEITR